MASAISMATTKAAGSGMSPALKKAHITTGANPKTEPTDRSNSPAVIRSVIASAIRPSSTVKVRALPMLFSDRKVGLITVKTRIIATSSTSGPNSGLATRRLSTPCSGGCAAERLDGSDILLPVE